MKVWGLGLGLVVGLVMGCAHAVTEKDVVGTWDRDPAAVNASKYPDMESKIVITITADHNYRMTMPTQQGFSGTWALADKAVTLTPVNIFTPNPANGQTIEVPIPQAMQQMQATGATPSVIESFQKAAQAQTLTISDDGKKMSDKTGPSLVKAGV